MLKDHYNLDPSVAQQWTFVMGLAWDFKLIYGLISDNVVLFGSRKKVFLIVGGLMQFFALQLLWWVPFSGPAPMSYLVLIVNILLAFMDLVVDGIMVTEARKDL